MNIRQLHDWDMSIAEARALQERLAPLVVRADRLRAPRLIAGLDISAPDATGQATAAAVVVAYPGLLPVEIVRVQARPPFPYVPGLLSFRELPLLIEVCRKIESEPDLVLVDGQGLAHPRRMGLACHLGLFLDRPTIGSAKSRLCGEHEEVGPARGDHALLMDGDETIGAALRTRQGVRPIYVSIGHMVDLPAALHWTLGCCRAYRVPEPLRLAHKEAGRGTSGAAMAISSSS